MSQNHDPLLLYMGETRSYSQEEHDLRFYNYLKI